MSTPTDQAKEMARKISRETGTKVSPDDPTVAIALYLNTQFHEQLLSGLKSHLLAQERILKSLRPNGGRVSLKTDDYNRLLIIAKLSLLINAVILVALFSLLIALW